jgi:GTP cyclohydrolase I
MSHQIPTDFEQLTIPLNREEKIRMISDRYREIMEILGLDLSDDSLCGTPDRIGRMFVDEIFSGLDPATFPRISLFENKYNSGMVTCKVEVTSFCEHHFVPMNGHAHIAYIPKDKVIGLSKIPRIVKYFSKRPQLQERLTAQIAESLAEILGVEDIAVWMNLKHFCVIARGVQDQQSHTVTQTLKGSFENDPNIRQEFFQSIVN